MGAHVERDRFDDDEYAAFGQRLQESLSLLAGVLDRPGFGIGPRTMGAELEASFVGADGRVAPISAAVQKDLTDPRIVSELAKFNVEANLGHRPACGPALAELEAELTDVISLVDGAARAAGGRLVVAGIVPSITTEDLGPDAITDEARYRALENGLERMRGAPVNLRIDGAEPLALQARTVALEGASTSWQLHLRVDPSSFRDFFNAARLATVVTLAASGNAPFFCGHRLWQETRVALFKQAVDVRDGRWPAFPRVAFGEEWLGGGAYDLFEQAVRHHPPLIPSLSPSAPGEDVLDGGAPALDELRLHLGTIWSWVRPVYDPVEGGHLRLELRALPSGPTARDMAAGAALLLGLTLAFADSMEEVVNVVPFAGVRRDFYRAAKRGLDAELAWPDGWGGLRRVGARRLVEELLPVAQRGLDTAGFDPVDSAGRLAEVGERVASRRTGAAWILARAAEHEQRYGRAEALRRTTLDYVAHASEGSPVHTWSVR